MHDTIEAPNFSKLKIQKKSPWFLAIAQLAPGDWLPASAHNCFKIL